MYSTVVQFYIYNYCVYIQFYIYICIFFRFFDRLFQNMEYCAIFQNMESLLVIQSYLFYTLVLLHLSEMLGTADKIPHLDKPSSTEPGKLYLSGFPRTSLQAP